MNGHGEVKEHPIKGLASLTGKSMEPSAPEISNIGTADRLLESQEKYRLIVEEAKEAICVAKDGKLQFVNPAMANLLAYPRNGLISRPFSSFVHPDDLGIVLENHLKRTKGEEAPSTYQFRLIDKNESTRWVETKSVRITWNGGPATLNFISDISERKQTEELYLTLTESSQIGIYILQDGKFRYANSRFREYFQDDLHGSVDIDPQRVIHPDDRENVRENARRMLKGDLSSSYEFRTIDQNGRIRWLLERVRSVSYNGKRAILGNAIDITDRKQMEDTLRRSDAAAQVLAKENAGIAQLGRIISSTLNIEEVYERFAEEVRKLIPFDRLAINIIDQEQGTITNAYILGAEVAGRRPGDVMPLAGSLNEVMMRTKKPLLIAVSDPEELKSQFPTLLTTFQSGLRSMLSVPLISSDQVIGVLHFRSIHPKAYSENDIRLAESIAAQISGAIANAKLFSERIRAEAALKKTEEEAKRLAQENAIMAEIGRIVGSTWDIRTVYNRFSETVRKLIPFDRMAINIPNLESKTFMIPYVSGMKVAGRREGEDIPLNGTIVEEVVRTRSSILVRQEELKDFLKRFPGLSVLAGSGFTSMLSVPLISNEQVIGILNLQLAEGCSYEAADLKLAEKVGAQIAGAIANAQLFAERQQAEKALKDSEEKYRLLVQNAKDAIFIIQNGVIKFSNLQTEKLFGYSVAELAAIPFTNHIHPADRETVNEGNSEGSEAGKYPKPQFFRIRNKSGQEVWLELRSIGIEWEGKTASLNFASDITEQKKLEAQFLQAQKMEAVGRLAGGVAHDFNNLLTIINANSQLALMELREVDPLREKFDSIQKAGEKAANLTRQLLAFSRRQAVEVKVLDLNTILQDLEKMLRRVIREDIDLNTLLHKNLGRVKVDPGQIEQAILNLVVNARDAMPSGGKLTIETCSVNIDKEYALTHMGIKPGRYVMLSVSDNGVGMKPEIQERIFEPFFTTKEKGKGTGLGLSTVYGVVKQSGGDISVYSELGQGTTFKIYLPQVDEPLEETTKKVTPGEIQGGHETILVVEDEEGVRNLAVAILKRYGYKVLEASQGGAAFLLCEQRKEPIHLLLSDVIMPEMGGPDFARRLKYFYPEIKVLFMSGYTDNALSQNGLLDGGGFFLQKPFSVGKLTEKVREVLDK